jgi:hypothetical protein
MNAIRVHAFGGPEVMKLEPVTLPESPPGHVRLRLAAAGVNFIDVYRRTGLYPTSLPITPGLEGAGEVIAIGPEVKRLKVGDRVAVISSPRGLENTVSDGLVSSIRQDEQRRLLQTTAPISGGSSGGPLFNSKGEVIGVTTLQMSAGQNLNFALPVEVLQELLQRRDNLTLPELQAQIAPRSKPRPKRIFSDVFETANAAFVAGRYLDALNGYESAQKLDPTESAAYYNAAKCYIELGNSSQAGAMYYLYLALAPDDDPDREAVTRWLTQMKLKRPNK